ncbi:MAG TPA: urate hydroxylase PuuD [Acidimicrobiia bacterium]|nr:urate hydroxylase PuuD [Acidimicrobiia bacterium]
MLHLAVNIFNREPGLAFLARWAHVVVGITWIGLLYYFNFVQVPSFAQMDAAARNNAVDKLASRALWWFRWAAAATLGFGILLLLDQRYLGKTELISGDYWKSSSGISIATGILLGVTMFLNVWLVIWPQQKKVIANARNVQAGGQADPAVPDAARRSALASRQNTIFSFPMLFFMVGTAHFFNSGLYNTTKSSDRGIYFAITAVIWAVFELSALGIIGGRAAGNITNWVYENHWRAIGTGLVLVVVWYALWEIMF